LQTTIKTCKAKLTKVRSARVKPRLDDKILTAWNALMLKAMLTPIVHLMILHFKQSLKSANFLNKKYDWKSNEVMRNYKNGQASIHGLLDDYALFRLLQPYTKLHLMKNGFGKDLTTMR
jgi:uncharacterized protein YyaL (SSP411 family)